MPETENGRAAPRWRGRPVWIEIDLDTVAENVRRIAAWVGPGTAVMAVVKADGYGLGAAQIGTAALAGGATWLAVASVDEGVQLREAGIDSPILVLGPTTPWETSRAVAARLTLTVNSVEVARALSAAARQVRVRAPVHLKLDTGLNRYGRGSDELVALAQTLAAMPGLRLEGLYTHFANAGEPGDDYAARQLDTLLAVQQRLARQRTTFALVHAASSTGILELPESHLDLVRAGIMLTGHYPAPDSSRTVRLAPVVTVHARIARLFTVPAGATVGYGRTYRAPGPRTLALVPMGYADGYHRALSNRGYMLVGGRRAPVVGRVSMDQTTIDVTGIPGVREGDPVVVVGRQGKEQVSFSDLAALIDTIPYELLTHLNKRLPRVYLQGGEVVQLTTLLGQVDLTLAEPLSGLPEPSGPAYADLPAIPVDVAQSWLENGDGPVLDTPEPAPRPVRRKGRVASIRRPPRTPSE
jgi:alanine racemase